jgi:hypothetical protein
MDSAEPLDPRPVARAEASPLRAIGRALEKERPNPA